MAEKSVENLIASIEISKKNDLSKLIVGLGINLIGAKAAKIISENFIEIDKIICADFDSFNSIDEIGEKMANSVMEFFSDEENIRLINRMKKENVNMKSLIVRKNIEDLIFSGLTFVVTGSLKEFKRVKIRIDVDPI